MIIIYNNNKFIGNEFTKNIETPIPPPLARNLIVIDVHITIPPDEPQVNLQNEPKKNSSNDRRMSRRQSNLPPNINANINLTKNQSKTKYIVEAHQVCFFSFNFFFFSLFKKKISYLNIL